MLKHKLLTLVAALILSIAAILVNAHSRQVRVNAITQSVTVAPNTAAKISQFQDR